MPVLYPLQTKLLSMSTLSYTSQIFTWAFVSLLLLNVLLQVKTLSVLILVVSSGLLNNSFMMLYNQHDISEPSRRAIVSWRDCTVTHTSFFLMPSKFKKFDFFSFLKYSNSILASTIFQMDIQSKCTYSVALSSTTSLLLLVGVLLFWLLCLDK